MRLVFHRMVNRLINFQFLNARDREESMIFRVPEHYVGGEEMQVSSSMQRETQWTFDINRNGS
jgi:hypothetical protein